ncbi:hypothetical protein MMC20_000137 [Loxospora ochrophaea]|nr:hypothetical protein [Loxospora ochrophaea]
MAMVTIAGITGKQFPQGTAAYQDQKGQYASSSHEGDHDMNPRLIVQAESKEDIVLAIQYARTQKIAVAIRTGGHQYSGASSTSSHNIQLDLKQTFRGPEDRVIFEKDGRTLFRTSVSWSLREFSAHLSQHQLFVPYGVCPDVYLGGHVQTGGYGQLGRSFGLLGDHVISLEIINHAGDSQEITKTSEPELFYAFLGGSPGNFGVLTHFTVKVHRDCDYQGSRGLKALYRYDSTTLKRLLNILTEMSDDENFPRNYDLCITVLSSSSNILDVPPEFDAKMKKESPEIWGEYGISSWPGAIVVYAQWVPFGKNDVCDMAWFDRFQDRSITIHGVHTTPMSKLAGKWIFRNGREFDQPYIKRCYLTNSTTLRRDGWASWVTDRIEAIVEPKGNRCWLSAQMQCFGGKHSKFVTNANNDTSYSWRDSTVICTLDCFHEPAARVRAEDWQKVNDREGVGPHGTFSKQERRVLWGSYGSFDLDKCWEYYYEDRAKYERLQKTRQAADPNGTFTPNSFCVKRLTSPRPRL